MLSSDVVMVVVVMVVMDVYCIVNFSWYRMCSVFWLF